MVTPVVPASTKPSIWSFRRTESEP
jgi:hypothetical protein